MKPGKVGRHVVGPPPTPTGTAAVDKTAATTATTATTASAHARLAVDHVGADVAHNAAHDMRYRVGVNAVSAGPTTTAAPKLLADWKKSLHEAAAEGRADVEVIDPALPMALLAAAQKKGDPLTRKEARVVEAEVRAELKIEYGVAVKAHLNDITKSPSTRAQTERDVVLAERPRVAKLKDPFTAVIQNQPNARDNEIVLWESKNFIVVVDTFADAPKALVVPKMALNLPVDAPRGLLDEAALVAAHVSDAFMRATGCQAAGIWINAPQNLSVAQMHVHVLPNVGPYTDDGVPAKAFLEDPVYRPQLEAWFEPIKAELKSKLGPSLP